MFRAILSANEHGEPVSIGFPISRAEYADVIAKLQQCGMGDVIKQDCRIEEVASKTFPVLHQLEGALVNVDELDYLAKRLDSFDIGEAAQFQAMAAKLELHKIADFINLTFCCQEATVVTDFSDLNKVGRDHYMNLHGGCAPVAELDALDGEDTARRLIASGGGTVTPYGVVYDNGMKLEQLYDGTHFPCYYYEPNLLTLTIHKKDMDFNEKTATWLFLPMAEEQINRTLLRSGTTENMPLLFAHKKKQEDRNHDTGHRKGTASAACKRGVSATDAAPRHGCADAPDVHCRYRGSMEHLR